MDCGAAYMGYPKSKRCPDCQQTISRARDRALRASGPNRHIGDTDLCTVCGKPYIVCGGLQRYCPDCAPGAVRENVRSVKREYAHKWVEQNGEYRRQMRRSEKVCAVCGRAFSPGDPSVTCSPECAKKWAVLQEQRRLYRTGKRNTAPGEPYSSGLPQSGVVGVTARRNGKWQATWKKHYIGVFPTVEAAAEAIERYKKQEAER